MRKKEAFSSRNFWCLFLDRILKITVKPPGIQFPVAKHQIIPFQPHYNPKNRLACAGSKWSASRRCCLSSSEPSPPFWEQRDPRLSINEPRSEAAELEGLSWRLEGNISTQFLKLKNSGSRSFSQVQYRPNGGACTALI
jgi:hypothetical protein